MFDDSRPLSDEQREYTKAIRWHLQIIGQILHVAKSFGGGQTLEEKRINAKLEEAWLLAKQHIEKCPDAAGHRLADITPAPTETGASMRERIKAFEGKIRELEEQRQADKKALGAALEDAKTSRFVIAQMKDDLQKVGEYGVRMEEERDRQRSKFSALVKACNEEGHIVTVDDSTSGYKLASPKLICAPSWKQLYADKNTECEGQRKLYQDKCKDYAVLHSTLNQAKAEYDRRLEEQQAEISMLRNKRRSATEVNHEFMQPKPISVDCNPCFKQALDKLTEMLPEIGINFSYSYNFDPSVPVKQGVGLHVSLRSAQCLANWTLSQCAVQRVVDTPITKA